jgi:hypothetical protein
MTTDAWQPDRIVYAAGRPNLSPFPCVHTVTGEKLEIHFDWDRDAFTEHDPNVAIVAHPILRSTETHILHRPPVISFYIDDSGRVYGIRG